MQVSGPSGLHRQHLSRSQFGDAASKLIFHSPQRGKRCCTGIHGIIHACRTPEYGSLEKATFPRYIHSTRTLHGIAQSIHRGRSHSLCRLGARVGSRRPCNLCRRTARADDTDCTTARSTQRGLHNSQRQHNSLLASFKYTPQTEEFQFANTNSRIRSPALSILQPSASVRCARTSIEVGQSRSRVLQRRMQRYIRGRQLRRR